MNDFTKEELSKIRNFIEHHKQDSYDDMRFMTIQAKLQSLIDNYCEHDWEPEYQGSIRMGIYCLNCRIKIKGSS